MDAIIIEQTLDDVENENFIQSLFEKALEAIPDVKKAKSPAIKRRLYESYGDKAFADPIHLKHPIINPDCMDTNEECYDCNLLLTTYYQLQKENANEELIDHIYDLLILNECATVKIKLESCDELIDLDTFVYYFAK